MNINASEKRSEKQLQAQILKFLTSIEEGCLGNSSAQLGWRTGLPADIRRMPFPEEAAELLKNTYPNLLADAYCPEDLLAVLRSPVNADSFRTSRSCFGSDDDFLKSFVKEALSPALYRIVDVTAVLRDTLKFKDKPFVLWMSPPAPGQPQMLSSAFMANRLRVVEELPFEQNFHCHPLYAEKLLALSAPVVKRIPDLTFFVNGLYFTHLEAKSNPAGQTIADAKSQVVGNILEIQAHALQAVRCIFGLENAGAEMPSLKSGVPAKYSHLLRAIACNFQHVPYILICDTESVACLPNPLSTLVEQSTLKSGDLSHTTANKAITAPLKDLFSTAMPLPAHVYACTGLAPKHQFPLFGHLLCCFHPEVGIHTEIHSFNRARAKTGTEHQTEVRRPRMAQRTLLAMTHFRTKELYSPVPKASVEAEQAGRGYRSILVQASTGVGKTHLILWTATMLAGLESPEFDHVLCLTDRTELRGNLGGETAANPYLKDSVVEAQSRQDLVAAFKAKRKIIVVNIQKFPSLCEELSANRALSLKDKQVAFLIDEAHRSQSGAYHESILKLFRKEEGAELAVARPRSGFPLVVSFTATPTDVSLAQFGDWRATSDGASFAWQPFLAYGMKEALADKVVLNPFENVMQFADYLQPVGNNKGVSSPSSAAVYGDDGRKQLIAKAAVQVFAASTMSAIRDSRNVSYGKALFVCNSITDAIAYHKHIREAFIAASVDSAYGESYRKKLAVVPVLVLYSPTQGHSDCTTLVGCSSEDDILDTFRRKGETNKKETLEQMHNAFLIVVDKLLTGFDEPTLHTLFIDRDLDDVLLFQTACRVNRVAAHKKDCLLVDFSHDNFVSKRLKVVSERFGGPVLSEFKPAELLPEMRRGFNSWFGAAKIDAAWTDWQQAETTVEQWERLKERLIVLRGTPAGLALVGYAIKWVNSWVLIRNLVDFTQTGEEGDARLADEERLCFTRQALSILRVPDVHGGSGTLEEEGFEILDHGLVLRSQLGDIAPPPVQQPPLPPTSKEVSKSSATLVAESLGTMATSSAWLANEEKKKELIEEVERLLVKLWEEVKKESATKNKGSYLKKLIEVDKGTRTFAKDELQKDFKQLLTGAVLKGTWTPEEHVLVDQLKQPLLLELLAEIFRKEILK